MSESVNYRVVVYLRKASSDGAQEVVVTFAEVEQYSELEAFNTMFNYLVENRNNYGNPITTGNHAFEVSLLSGDFTICMDCVDQTQWDSLRARRNAGEIVPDNQLIRKCEKAAEENCITTVIVGHLWDDDPNNGKPDFTHFDFAFLLQYNIGHIFTSIYDIPFQLELSTEFLESDPATMRRDNGAILEYTLSNKYERWTFQVIQGRVEGLDADGKLGKFYGYVPLSRARNIVAECVTEKNLRRKENHKTEAYKNSLKQS